MMPLKNNLSPLAWWEKKRPVLLDMGRAQSPCYVYSLETQSQRAVQLHALESITQVFYAIKANPNIAILKHINAAGIGFECVSLSELEHIFHLFPNIDKKTVLFTPNFASQAEYAFALTTGCYITIDSLYPLVNWSSLFRKKNIILRIDPGKGRGHHRYVQTGGKSSKFGISVEDLPEVSRLSKAYDFQVIGLHAHVGSGILEEENWLELAVFLESLTECFPGIKILNLGGGFGVPDKVNQKPLDLKHLDNALLAIKKHRKPLDFWIEPGRFLVAESGVLLAKVTQIKQKDGMHFIGIETGMNSLIRPALYQAYHEVVNLTRLTEPVVRQSTIVGPICESADCLAWDRWFPETRENDIILIANVGAYGFCMHSYYNLRQPAKEIILPH